MRRHLQVHVQVGRPSEPNWAYNDANGTILLAAWSRIRSVLLATGLQRVSKENVIGNFKIIGNPRLQDISALGTSLRCKDGVPGSVNSTAVLGVIQVIPKDPFPFWNTCLMSTAGQARDPSPFLALLDRNQTIPAYEEKLLKEESSSLQSHFSTLCLGLDQATCLSFFTLSHGR
jgi:hypothetical protein